MDWIFIRNMIRKWSRLSIKLDISSYPATCIYVHSLYLTFGNVNNIRKNWDIRCKDENDVTIRGCINTCFVKNLSINIDWVFIESLIHVRMQLFIDTKLYRCISHTGYTSSNWKIILNEKKIRTGYLFTCTPFQKWYTKYRIE